MTFLAEVNTFILGLQDNYFLIAINDNYTFNCN